ncbi:phage tail terminator-like protein [Micavibrio aeruginosavorus]|uniref:DUF3168 domain-containing protein n=1 Tax=Micavibrio aeruginosavorus (strain ARL-13) TaxID=856793 RepID=G2KMV7_MICAA|nr:phage tail terminator-like protein [Micavibrio aeruginosavorus]AEP08889.1 hypothetical protein MICA_552 [Micavibrio aeruginosavorus ARL-13]
MKFEQAEAAVRAYFNTGWAARTPIAWPDVSFTPPNNATWVRFSMKNNDGYQASMGSPGSNRFRRVGMVYIDIFQPAGQGSIDARKKADIAHDIFLANTLPGITFSNINARDIGKDATGAYQWKVSAAFKYDRIA